MKFVVVITEILSKQIDIEADSKEEAERTARKMYKKEDVVLDWNDHDETVFEVFPEQ